MTDRSVRPEVIHAIFTAITTMDPGEALALYQHGHITPAEREQAQQLVLAAMTAGAEHRERVAEVWSLLLAPSPNPSPMSNPNPTWADLFDDLTPDRVRRLGELYDALPDGACTEYDGRYGRPDLGNTT